jgi:ATP-dependent DNA ligase
VRLYSRPGNDLTPRFPLIVKAVSQLRGRSIIIDGEAVACGDDGIPTSTDCDTATMMTTSLVRLRFDRTGWR